MHGLLHFYFLHDLLSLLLWLVLCCMHEYCIGGQRSKSLESCKGDEKKERRISWGVNGTDDRRSLGKRRFSEELKRRRHTVAGDVR